ncbi:MAG: hydantoinase/oxoprolinase family protein [Haloferacaceae archaeon]
MTETTINIDAGGTFTDGFITVGETTVTSKVPTTEHDLTVCFMDCIEAGAEKLDTDPAALLGDADMVRFSTTAGTNTVIEKTGPRLGLLVTAGHEDDLYAEAGQRTVADSVLDADMVEGIDERVSEAGEVLEAPDPEAVSAAVKRLQADGARLIVVALANADANPANERAVKAAIDDAYPRHYLGAIPTLASFEVTARPDDYRRLNTVAANAYIHHTMKSSLYKAEDEVRARNYDRPLFVGHSSGGVARVAKTVALNTYNSGPAAGVLGAAALAERYDTDLVAADMGGTSIDVSRVGAGGEIPRELGPSIDGLPTHVPAIDVNTAGAGGGSIASVEDGAVSVGPESAGANPGPACFGRGGTEPTVTDADVVLGRVNPDFFLGGDYELEADRAVEAVREKVAEPLGVDVEEAARRIVDRTEANIADAIDREVGAADAMVSYGGAGPMHAAGVADRLGVERVIVTPHSSVFSTFGESTMNVEHVYTRSLTEGDPEDLLTAMREEAERDMRAEGFDADEIEFGADLLVDGTGPAERRELAVALPDGGAGGEQYGVDAAVREALGDDASAAATLRLHAVGPAPSPEFSVHPLGDEDPAAARVDTREVVWADGPEPTAIYRRESLDPGAVVPGPAVVEAPDTTVVVPESRRFRVNELDHGLLEPQ